ncbi:MAG: YybS family protein, partial [Syntrophomonadaceae bacterium]|nr:YybS family protein [Syntrophomonadaceae bacterium]
TVPITILMVKRSPPSGLLALAMTAVLTLVLAPSLVTVSFIAQFAPVGVFYGVALNRKWHPGIVALGGIGTAMGSLALVLLLTFRSAGIALAELGQPVEEMFHQSLAFYHQAGVFDSLFAQGVTPAELEEYARQVSETYKRLLPGLLAIGAMGTSVLNYLITCLVGNHAGLELRRIPPFSQWQLPWYFTWGVVVGLAALLGGDYWQLDTLSRIGQNLLLVFAPVLFVFGASVVVFYYRRSPLPAWFKISIIVLATFYLTFSLMLVMALGLFDPLFGYRRRST